MENEREKSLRKELSKLAQDSKPRGDSLLRLIKKLQRLHASAPSVKSVTSRSKERAEVAQAVEDYLLRTKSDSTTSSRPTASYLEESPTRSPFQVSQMCDVDPFDYAAHGFQLMYECAQCGTIFNQLESKCLKCDCVNFVPLVFSQRP
jgi:hypothetical protein